MKIDKNATKKFGIKVLCSGKTENKQAVLQTKKRRQNLTQEDDAETLSDKKRDKE